MSTLREQGELEVGVVIGESVFRSFTLRPATLNDSYAGAAAVPVPEKLGEDKSANVGYQMAVEDAQILCQIERLGSLDTVPDVPTLVAALDPDDMTILRQHAALLKKKLRLSRPGLPPIVEPNTSLSEPASA